jgi:ATP-dependent DNA helicase RecG
MPPSSSPRASAKSTSSRNRRSSSSTERGGDRTGAVAARPARAPAAEHGGELATPLSALKGVGPKRAAELAGAGIETLEHLLFRFPLRYEDRGHPRSIASAEPGTPVSVVGTITRCSLRSTRRPGFTIFEAAVRDDTGVLSAVWFNQRFLRDVFHPGQRVALFGRVEGSARGLQLVSPDYEILDDEDSAAAPDEGAIADADLASPGPQLHTGRIVPVYERIGTVTPRVQRTLVAEALAGLSPTLQDWLPAALRIARGWPRLREALHAAHFPGEDADVALLNACRSPAQIRLVFEEFFTFQLGLALERRDLQRDRKAFVVRVDERIRAAARAVLPFKLTPGQRRATAEIVDDMQRDSPMNRLLQGDVGAGKTIVALLAALVAMENGLQVAFMAPTEILAEQHFDTLKRLLAPSRFHVALLTGSTTAADRRMLRRGIEHGIVPLVVGTHALVEEAVRFKSLGLVVIDEQHRFGVVQRAELRRKGLTPDVLVMTATPIPRTLALTTYGNLDVSTIRDLPPGRAPVKTTVRPESKRREVYAFVEEQLNAGRQAYVVFPLVEESDKIDLRAATEMADHLAADVFPSFRVALLHGRMSADAKERVMSAFAQGEIHVLVSTSVIEVGIDVANAAVMVIEHAERFGLAQLHQLRGRVGRGSHPSYCVLLYQSPLSDEARARLKAIAETHDGFAIAERDLALRGPGDFFGTRQSGLPALRLGDLLRDQQVMEDARREAIAWLETASPDDPLVHRVRRIWAARFGLVGVG